MKKVIFQVAVLMMTTGYVMAKGAIEKEKPATSTSKVEVVATAKKAVYKLNYSSEVVGVVKVNIYDAKGDLMYTDIVKGVKAFQKSYDFNGLEAGNYSVEVTNAEGRVQQTVQIVADAQGLAASVSSLDEKGKYQLQVLRKQMKPVVVNIYDANDNLIFEDLIDVTHNFSRVYDFTKAYDKAAAFVVYSDGAVVRQEIR
jgi:hypothetical protein